MTTDSIHLREEKGRRACRWMLTGYMLFGGLLTGYYALVKNFYLLAQTVGSMAAVWAILAVLHWAGIRPVYQAYAVIIGFTFAAYTLGVACALYKVMPGYDKLLHMLSGTLTMMLALPLFYTLKSGHRVERADYPLAAVFCFAAALAVAGIWELAEFALGLTGKLDPQCVQATGVTDTMLDMLVCALGAALALPALAGYYRGGRGGVLYGWTEIFIEKNLTDRSERERSEPIERKRERGVHDE